MDLEIHIMIITVNCNGVIFIFICFHKSSGLQL